MIKKQLNRNDLKKKLYEKKNKMKTSKQMSLSNVYKIFKIFCKIKVQICNKCITGFNFYQNYLIQEVIIFDC